MKAPEQLIKISNRADVMAIFAHILCCGVPAFVSILSLITNGAIAGSTLLVSLSEWTENMHFTAFVFSTVMVAIALGSFFIARTRDCVKEGACHHEPCAPQKQKSWRLLTISITLYCINLALFFIEFGHSH